MNFATIARIKQGQFAAPGPDKLARIAEALGLNAAICSGSPDYTVPDDLPSFQPYLRSKYRDMPKGAVRGPQPGLREDHQATRLPARRPTRRRRRSPVATSKRIT